MQLFTRRVRGCGVGNSAVRSAYHERIVDKWDLIPLRLHFASYYNVRGLRTRKIEALVHSIILLYTILYTAE